MDGSGGTKFFSQISNNVAFSVSVGGNGGAVPTFGAGPLNAVTLAVE